MSRNALRIAVLLAAIHSLTAGSMLAFYSLGAIETASRLLDFLFIIDFPASLIAAMAKGQLVPIALILSVIGGFWWLIVGLALSNLWKQASVSTGITKALLFAMLVFIIGIGAHAFQLAAQLGDYAAGSCVSIGLPIVFLEGCYGALSLYWPAIDVSVASLLSSIFVWTLVAIGFWLLLPGWSLSHPKN